MRPMNINSASGWLDGVSHVPSDNFNDRPHNTWPQVIIVHAISLPPGKYGGGEIEDLFCNRLDCDAHSYFDRLRTLRVSAHLLVRRDGQVIQFVSLHKRAWHAGRSHCLGRDNVNDFSIGIELEGCDDDRFEDAQYVVLNDLIELIGAEYPQIQRNSIFGHSDIAPGRKTDPGPYFDWDRIR